MMINLRVALSSAALMTLATAGPKAVLAGDITDLFRQPVQTVSPFIPLLDVSTAVPTTNEIFAVPAPSRENLTAYPVNLFRYGLTVSPSARILQQNGLMFYGF